MELEDTGSFRAKLTASQSEVTLIDFQQIDTSKKEALKKGYFIGTDTRIESLSIWVSMLGFHDKNQAEVPNFREIDTENEKAKELLRIWNAYPRLEIELLERENTNQVWESVAEIKVQNRGFSYYINGLQPYLTADEVLVVGESYQLGARVKEVEPHGGLTGSDYILIRGSWSQKLTGSPSTLGVIDLVNRKKPDAS